MKFILTYKTFKTKFRRRSRKQWPNREDLGNVRKVVAEEHAIENGKVFEKAELIFGHGKLPAMQKMFNVGEADFLLRT
jgi:hypothetical protein